MTTRKRILIAEDDEEYREILRAMLAAKGYEVETAADGLEALRRAQAAPPDLLMTDFNMPLKNGYELVCDLRARPETLRLPVVLFTGSSNRQQLSDFIDRCCTVLEKPLSYKTVLAAIESYLGKGIPADAQAAAPPAESARAFELGGRSTTVEELLVETAQERDEDTRLDDAADSPLVEQINRLMIHAVELGASDVHFEPQPRELVVRMRVDGRLRRIGGFPAAFKGRLVARIKIMASLVITERRRPQDGHIRAEFKGRRLDFRVSSLPSQHGEKVVMRLLGAADTRQRADDLGLSARDQESVQWALKAAHGLILVTGPTGSGKSTTLYTMINALNAPDVSVMTAEDPVEREIPGVTQVPARPAVGLTFDAILRSFLRQDPDVMMVGEIRDPETADVAVRASITGHLVLSTLHTNSAPWTVTRLINMGVVPHLVASSLRLVVAQRLIRTLCGSCKRREPPAAGDLQMLDEAERRSVADSFGARGCDDCQGTGYKGRKPLFEVMPVRSARMRAEILSFRDASILFALAREEGMRTLRESALEAVAAGQTSLTEALPVIVSD